MKSNAWCAAALVAIIVAGALLRAWPIASLPIWYDEADTWQAAIPVRYSQFFDWTAHYENAPLSFLLVRLTTDLLGTTSPWAMRIPSLVFGVLCIPAAFWLGYVIRGRGLGLLMALFIAVDPNNVDQSQQCRMYTMLALLVMVSLGLTILLLRNPRRGLGHGWAMWLALGVTLGLALWATLLAVCLWIGIAGAIGVYALAARATRQDKAQPWRIAGMGVVAFLAASAVAYMGVYKTVARFIHPGADAPGMRVVDVLREVVATASDLLHLTPAGLLVWVFAAVGLLMLWRTCRTSVIVLVVVTAAFLVLMIPFRRTHRFLDPRYMVLIEPALWAGPGMFVLGWRNAKLRAGALGLMLLFAAAEAWNSTHLDSWYEQPDRYLISPQILRVQRDMAPGDALALCPEPLYLMAEYYNVPADPSLKDAIYDDKKNVRQDAAVFPPTFQAKRTWLVIGMINWPGAMPRSEAVLKAVAGHYGLNLTPDDLKRYLQLDHVTVAEVSAAGIVYRVVGPR